MIKHRIYPPLNWFDFEQLCLKLWGQIWTIPNEIDLNSTNSQGQDGVDIYGIPKGEKRYFGIQCKNYKDEKKSGARNRITKKIVDTEIQNAEKFNPTLQHFIIATSLEKDKNIEEYVRTINQERLANNKFTVQICFWDYITQMMYDYKEIYNWYYNQQNLNHNKKVSVFFKNSDDPLRVKHFPTYIKLKKVFRLETQKDIYKEKQRNKEALLSLSKNDDFLPIPFYERILDWLFRKKNSDKILSKELFINGINIRSEEYRRSLYPKEVSDLKFTLNSIFDNQFPLSIKIIIDNIGDSVIEDYKLRLYFDGDFEKIDTKTPRISEIFAKTVKHDVFVNGDTCLIQPEKNFLVQKDFFVSEAIILIPKLAANTEIKIKWELISRDYNDKGELYINIEPNFELKTKEYLVLDINDCKEVDEYHYQTYESLPTQPNW
ncbi:hypothetical protein IX39_08935 [Chryseobacterium formosense]|uniref:Mrr-like domain-containing protein n=1 Tax=Chryseobacterium formosense TaxID=236814 RepID=A0A085Z8G8_9FLAO|nr:hypothetical protein [Chryseobacterium formosense]KFF00732.1 hypothetical protein IX39_08935 [Chryseobacterium formosense]SFT37236.1 Restriction endonuclease [Chryseobacterium formosense]